MLEDTGLYQYRRFLKTQQGVILSLLAHSAFFPHGKYS